MRIDQLSLLVTTVLAFSALAALVLTGQAGIRDDLRALRADMLAGQAELRAEMRAGQAELRAGQVQTRDDLTAFGTRLAVVEHRVDTLESRVVATDEPATEQPAAQPCEGTDCPGS